MISISRWLIMKKEKTRALLEYLLHMLDEQGEDATFAYIRKEIVGKKEYPVLPERKGNL